MMVILIHELGHIIAALFFSWHIKRVIVLPFGCMTEFQEKLNRPIYQELVILIMGPIFQLVFFYCYPNPYHIPILIFNLLPIYPLDGSKLIFLFWNKIGTYYNSYRVVFFVSIITIFTFLYYMRSLLFLAFGMFFIWNSIVLFKQIPILFNIFLFERYKYSFKFKRFKKIKKCKLMKRDYEHLILMDKKYINEKAFLAKTFDK